MKTVIRKFYKGTPDRKEVVEIEDTHFVECQFQDSILVYSGQGGSTRFDSCDFFAGLEFSFVGPAGETVATLTALYQSPAFRPLIEMVLKNIRTGVPPQGKTPPWGMNNSGNSEQ